MANKFKKILSQLMIAAVLFSLTTCNWKTEQESDKYGLKAKNEAKARYLKRLGGGDYISEEKMLKSKLEGQKTAYNKTLKRQYLAFSKNLALDKDYTDSTYFRRKALNAEKKSFQLMPEDPDKWHVKNDDDLKDLRKAREKLLEALVGYTPIISPDASASAMVYYDCWVQQSQQKKSQFNKQNCKSNFQTNYAKVDKTADHIEDRDIADLNEEYKWVTVPTEAEMDKKIAAREKAVKSAQKAAAAANSSGASPKTANAYTANGGKPKAVDKNFVGPPTASQKVVSDKTLITDQSDGAPDIVFIVYFDKVSAELTDAAKAELDKSIAEINKNSPASISVNGHTDRSLDSGASLLLSKKRADIVRNYLVSKGISSALIHTYGFGKTDNLVANKEGEVQSGNQRAEIVFKSKVQAK